MVRQPRSVLQAAVVLFTVTTFTGSGLLFLVQPMFAKQVLPGLGGSPAVWNTCMLFFQATLLLGYLYAHASTRWLGPRRQAIVHLLLLAAPAIGLPIIPGSASPDATEHPVRWLLSTMTISVGVPFFVVSTSAPLLQRWFATLPVSSARDPYFLYAASNLGSLTALVAYPLLVEPTLGIRTQSVVWAAGYFLFAVLTAACVWFVRVFGSATAAAAASAADYVPSTVSLRDRTRWVLLSFLPSSLMLGVTTHISTDIAAVPLLWIVPFAMYLLTFVLAFSQRAIVPRRLVAAVLWPLVLATVTALLLNRNQIWMIPLHLVTFFCSAMACHLNLAAARPGVSHLTEFYLWVSFGGMLGGVFNSLIAPNLFSFILEYPILLAAVPFVTVLPRATRAPAASTLMKIAVPIVALSCCAVWAVVPLPLPVSRVFLVISIGLAIPLVLNQRTVGSTIALIVTVGLVGLLAIGQSRGGGHVLLVERSFFGVHKVIESPDHTHRVLLHGNTVHGWQQLPGDSTCEPSSYYATAGPFGQLIARTGPGLRDVAVVGLGTGALGCYAEPKQNWTFYEIDPVVRRIASSPALFTQLRNSRGNLSIVLGDGRTSLQRAAPDSYDLLVLDAFSSDSIPVHMLTREAIGLYLSRLRAGGILAVHISNRYLELEPVLAALAGSSGLYGLSSRDRHVPPEDAARGRTAAQWVVLSTEPEKITSLRDEGGWKPLQGEPRVHPWTDDYSNVLQALILRWRRAAR